MRPVFAALFILLILGCSEDDKLIEPEPDTTRPGVVSTSPDNNACNIPVDAEISITFSEKMKATSINSETFIISDNTTGSINYEDSMATFTPSGVLMYDHGYVAYVYPAVEDEAGNQLGDYYIWTFSTMRWPDTTGNRD
jgi:hypothetical protein